ncbi:MAG: phosphatase PAP2 family protein [Promethearchaeota archaeon]
MEKEDKLTLILITSLIISIILIIVVLLIPFLFNFSMNQALRDLLPGSSYFFRFITEFGGTFIYLVIIFTIFWGIDKKIANSLLMVYVSSNFVNYYAKAIIANERPPEAQWLLIGASHLSTPSGHAMSSTVFYGYLSMKTKRIAMWIISIVVIMLVGLSRIYLGVHWVGDVLTGWFFGIVILLLAYIFEDKIQDFTNKYNIVYLYIGLAVLGLLVMIITDIIYQSSYNFGEPGGQMIGLGIGLALEHKYVNFEISYQPGEKWKIILRILLGILLIAIIFLGLYLVIDSDILWLSALHYIVTLILGIFIWPLIFTKIGL